MISQKDLFKRKAVWVAMSEFYLDSRLEKQDLQRIAIIFKDSGYSISELKRINHEEVAPVVSPNLMSTAGVWSGFDEEWLESEIVKKINAKGHKSIFNTIYKRYIDWMTKSYWREIEEIIK